MEKETNKQKNKPQHIGDAKPTLIQKKWFHRGGRMPQIPHSETKITQC